MHMFLSDEDEHPERPFINDGVEVKLHIPQVIHSSYQVHMTVVFLFIIVENNIKKSDIT